MVFSSSTFAEECLQASATSLPPGLPEQDVNQRVRQGFLTCLMSSLNGLGPRCEALFGSGDQVSLVQLAGYAYMFGSVESAQRYYGQALKSKPMPNAIVSLFDAAQNQSFTLEIQSLVDRDVPPQLTDLRDDSGFSSENVGELTAASRCPDRLVFLRALLRIAHRCPKYTRKLAILAVQTASSLKYKAYLHYTELALLVLLQAEKIRTFLLFTATFLDKVTEYPSFVLRPFVDCITSGDKWCEQRITPAAKLLGSSKVPRFFRTSCCSTC
jgi:hypothetical protein